VQLGGGVDWMAAPASMLWLKSKRYS